MEGERILPFLWLHGEAESIIREEIAAIAQAGMAALCVESRPHPDFCGPLWWRDLDAVMGEAKRRGMRVWLLDDAHFPTGYANGLIRTKYPERAKRYLAEMHADACGPLPGALFDSPIDLSSSLRDGLVRWDVPEGLWRLFIVYETSSGGGNPDYLNPIDRKSVEALIEAVYEPHYERYKAEFGLTFSGFFSDEPGMGNTAGYAFDEDIGRKKGMVLPWCGELRDMLSLRLRDGFARSLPFLWAPGSEAPRARYAYMDVATSLYRKNFSEQLGEWCRARGGQYIGHAFFGGEWEGEFFHYALAKLASSLAHIDAGKKGIALCEIFGAYGWSEGLKLMKWLVDHMLVRGINRLVPHAFNPKEYPDPDCPPHFYAHGRNPQYRHFGYLMRYADRLCGLLGGGTHVAPVAILYHAAMEWCGDYMPCETPARVLAQNQIDYDIVPEDLISDTDRYAARTRRRRRDRYWQRRRGRWRKSGRWRRSGRCCRSGRRHGLRRTSGRHSRRATRRTRRLPSFRRAWRHLARFGPAIVAVLPLSERKLGDIHVLQRGALKDAPRQGRAPRGRPRPRLRRLRKRPRSGAPTAGFRARLCLARPRPRALAV